MTLNPNPTKGCKDLFSSEAQGISLELVQKQNKKQNSKVLLKTFSSMIWGVIEIVIE